MAIVTVSILLGLYRYSPAAAVVLIFGFALVLGFLLYPWWVSRKKIPADLGKDSGPSCDLSIVVPAYNEELRIPIMLKQTLSWLEAKGAVMKGGKVQQTPAYPWLRNFELIVVNDGSTDRTEAVAEKFGVRVISLTQNSGKGEAVRVGMLNAKGRLILMADADGATDFSDLERLVTAMTGESKEFSIIEIQPEQQEEAELLLHSGTSTPSTAEESLTPMSPAPDRPIAIFGSRDHLKSSEAVVERDALRNFLMLGFHACVWLLVGTTIKDTQCGFKLFTRSAARRIFGSLHLERWAFDIEIIEICRRLEISITEVPVNWHEVPGSKLNLVTGSLGMLRDMAAVRFLYATGLWKVC